MSRKNFSLPPDRLEVLKKIAEYENEGGEAFFRDVEPDPPSRPLTPEDVDYLHKRFRFRFHAVICRRLEWLYKQYYRRALDIRVEGAENLRGVTGGAVFTSNHFAPTENLAVKLASEQARPRRRMYKVIREGNYFMSGIFGYLLKYCDTLPLSSNVKTMVLFEKAVAEILARGDFILIYPEQSMWWNYLKPRPYRIGAYYFAAKNNVPVVPCFVTLRKKNDRRGETPENIAYTIHVMPPLYADASLTVRQSAEKMRSENFELCRAVYEKVYGKPLVYGDSRSG